MDRLLPKFAPFYHSTDKNARKNGRLFAARFCCSEVIYPKFFQESALTAIFRTKSAATTQVAGLTSFVLPDAIFKIT